MAYDRVLSAEQREDGSFMPKAYTLCLPYEFRYNDLVEPGKIRFYQHSFVDDYYKRFVFTAVDGVAEAGKAYLAVVDRGDVSLNAFDVMLVAEPVSDSESIVVNDYADWYFNENLTRVGQWTGSFTSISAADADSKNMFCLLADGSWVRFTSEDNAEATLNAFRGFYLADAPAETRAAKAPADGTKRFRTLFGNAKVGSVSDGNVPDALNILYEADIPVPSTATGIEPVVETIEADGSHRYFDMSGRQLSHKPERGIYIDNNKKVLAK